MLSCQHFKDVYKYKLLTVGGCGSHLCISGLKRFSQFLYELNFILHVFTNHKVLVALVGPTEGMPALTANCLAYWALTEVGIGVVLFHKSHRLPEDSELW